jgi:hypothetical protein
VRVVSFLGCCFGGRFAVLGQPCPPGLYAGFPALAEVDPFGRQRETGFSRLLRPWPSLRTAWGVAHTARQLLSLRCVHCGRKLVRFFANAFEFFRCFQAIVTLTLQASADHLHDAGDADLEELIEVSASDREELDALQ